MTKEMSLDDKYTAREGRVFMSGTQALVRLPMVQMWRDRAAGLKTGTYISGYRGSPLGGYDQQLQRARKFIEPLDIVFQPGVNEELAATAVWGSQQLQLSPGAKKDSILGIWYGKGPGVDRCGDVFKHGNAAGTAPNGGVLCLAGDDHGCKSSTIPHQSDHAFAAALMPMMFPSSVHEFVEMGLFAIAMSRFSGLWTGMKTIADTVETSAAVDLSGEHREFVIPDFKFRQGGPHWRWPDPPMIQDARFQNKGQAALAFAYANGVDVHAFKPAKARYGIVASGKAFEDTRQALIELDLDDAAMQRLGLSLYKVRMPWPLEPNGIRHFAEGLEEVLIVEERREMIENQIKTQLFNWRRDVRPRVVGKYDEHERKALPFSDPLTAVKVAEVLAERLLMGDMDDSLRGHIESQLAVLRARTQSSNAHEAPVVRTPYFCSGCPHNTSTRVPEGSRATAGIGCHYMAVWMDRRTEAFTAMGGEGVPWLSQAHFTDETHHFANLGDGTYFHSGIMAIRAAVASGVNITYKVLYNDAVAMTGGQTMDGDLSPERMTRQLHAEGVAPIYLVTDTPEVYDKGLAPGVILKHRDELDNVMLEIRETKGCSAIVYVQTCAAEKRRRRKRGLMEDPAKRVFINPEVCEGCGDCSVQSNCVSVEPLETAMGRKRAINQSSCNKDFSCVKGFCPSFVTVYGGDLKKPEGMGAAPDGLPEPSVRNMDDGPVNIAVTGVGGTGVLTIGGILGMAAHIDGKASMVLNMAGLAQKGGAVISHVRLGQRPDDVAAPRIASGKADVLLAADDVVASGQEGVTLFSIERTVAVVNTAVTPVADFVRDRNFDFKAHAVEATIKKAVSEKSAYLNFGKLARAVAGDTIATNIMMVGYACQLGVLPVSRAAIEDAIRLNGVAVQANLGAFGWGRAFAAQPDLVEKHMGPEIGEAEAPLDAMSLDEIIAHRERHLRAYHSGRLAKRYRRKVEAVREALDKEHTRLVAIHYAKVLAPKDEYEVARLLTAPGFRAGLERRFDGDVRLKLNLAPPILGGEDPSGRPKKREFGPWLFPVLGLMKRFRWLRGTLLDPFGKTEERRRERDLARDYEALIDACLAHPDADPIVIGNVLALPDQVRGFGPVKMAGFARYDEEKPALLAALTSPIQKMAAE